MNHLLVGPFEPNRLLQLAQPDFLLLDDGPIADDFAEQFPDATIFNPRRHSFAPQRDYKSVRDFTEMLFPDKDLMTYRNGKRALTRMLLDNTTLLHKLEGDRKDPADAEALATIDDLLLSPVLRRVLTRKPNFDFKGSVICRLNRAELGDFDALILGTLLISQHPGSIIIPDLGFYGRPLHTNLIRQNRLVSNVSYLTELEPKLRQAALTMKHKTVYRTSPEDVPRLLPYLRTSYDPQGQQRSVSQPAQLTDLENGDYLTTLPPSRG